MVLAVLAALLGISNKIEVGQLVSTLSIGPDDLSRHVSPNTVSGSQ